MSHKILVVDDEPSIRRLLRGYLEAESFAVSEAATGCEALALVRSGRPDVVLLDVRLPDLGGIEVLREIRSFSDVFVLLVTARSDEVDKLVGLAVGADDYITKPFSPREVVARVRTVLRRTRGAEPAATRLVFPGLVVDADARQVTVDGHHADVTALEFDLLSALARTPGRVYSRRQLLENVWDGDFFGDERVVDVHIRSIRRALGDDAAAPRFIGTVRGVGYKFLPPSGELR
ncbi:response regulator transcription factor [Rhodococcoides yunnanense]|uniref:response regulator transcription factor n=1 Tax=Rhodococcoides yunnanense TaxID=278209 RepID=UPI0022B19522|nr:response regulator transcription factor [Rhodococcus yunnanensis]MCZ4278559.1 response regulator transcription factor [Rhodococcus yunnanensis]